MKYKSVIFDFNGTLVWDTPLHNEAWNVFMEKYQLEMNKNERWHRLHGKGNKDILTIIFGKELSSREIERFTLEKEGIYQQLCVKHAISFAPGAVDFFEFLKEKQIPFTIATSSGKENVDFFLEFFELSKWFSPEKIVFSNGTFPGKPAPDIFRLAAAKNGVSPQDSIVFEDALAGIQAAENAEIGKIFIVDSTNADFSTHSHQIIHHFNEIDRNLF